MSAPSTIVWFRHDLRVVDQPALAAAVARGGPVIPVFIWAPEEEKPWAPGEASMWWLHHSLERLNATLERKGSRLLLRRGPTLDVLEELVRKTGADAVYWNRRCEPNVIARDKRVKKALKRSGLEVRCFNGSLLFEPRDVQTKQGGPFKVFTPFWRACCRLEEPPEPLGTPRKLPSPARWPSSLPLAKLDLEPTIDWAGGIRASWRPGRRGAEAELERFLEEAVATYDADRDRPDRNGTSRLSPHLHLGEISPREVWHAVKEHAEAKGGPGMVEGAEAYLRELGWREFACHLLYHFPHTTDRPLRPEFEDFPWRRNKRRLKVWSKGQTGFPVVDAGMRQLWQTGWMHNRVRMIVASFLIKDLNIPWQDGARWFWDTLVDADLASNTLGWQWTAGCGADAAPYFRVFNPVTQGERYDPGGAYVKEYVPELRDMPARFVHRPWEAPGEVRKEAQVALGATYPQPMLDHAEARKAALAAYGEFTG